MSRMTQEHSGGTVKADIRPISDHRYPFQAWLLTRNGSETGFGSPSSS